MGSVVDLVRKEDMAREVDIISREEEVDLGKIIAAHLSALMKTKMILMSAQGGLLITGGKLWILQLRSYLC